MAGLNLPSLKIDILADGTSAIQEINSVGDAVREMSRLGSQMSKFTTVPIVTALTAAVKSAGDFNETLGKTEVVFGSMTDTVMTWSENSVQAMGLAQSTALEMASTYGDMATGMGLATAEAAEMSMGITQLAADIASFKNKSISDVNTSMTGIFTGETESLKQLGIVMTQTNLQAFALEQGISKTLSEMSQAEQVQLRYAYVMAQSANAQGDFVRTGDSLNNQARKLTETIKQLANEFGAPLTEKVAGVAATLQSAAQWLSELDDGTKSTILNIGLLVAAAGPLLLVGGKVVTMVENIGTQLSMLAANPVVLSVAGILAGISAVIAIANKAGKELDETSQTYQKLKKAVEGGAEGKVSVDDSEIQALTDNPPTVTIQTNAEFTETEETKANIQAFADKLATLPRDETYSATGEFTVSEATTETVQEYAAALAAVATATGDYAAAVDNLNSIVDSETQRKIAEVNEQIAAEAQKQAALLSEGLVTDEQASAAVQQAIRDGEEKIALIEAEAEAQKQLNETYNNGIKADDAPTAANALLGLFEGAELTEEQRNASSQRLLESYQQETIGDEQSLLDAQIQLNSLRAEALADQEALTEATEKYNTAIAAADNNEQTAINDAETQKERLGVLSRTMDEYSALISSGSFTPEEAISLVLSNFETELSAYEGLADELKGILQGEDGKGLGYADTLEALNSVDSMTEEADTKITAATEEATTARETALAEFQTTLAEIQEGFTESEAAGALALVEQAGVAVDELDKQMILGGTQAIADLAGAIENGEDDIADAMETALEKMGASAGSDAKSEGVDIGKNITAGVAQGISSGTGTAMAAARQSARMVTDAYKNELAIKSPSRVARDEIGLQFAKGVGVGIEKGMPEVLKIIRSSTDGLVSSATGVLKQGVYAVPTQTTQSPTSPVFDYEKLADAVTRRPIAFSVGMRQLVTATRDETARQQAIRVQQINRSYGNGG